MFVFARSDKFPVCFVNMQAWPLDHLKEPRHWAEWIKQCTEIKVLTAVFSAGQYKKISIMTVAIKISR